jgi:S-adenosylmethionine/arginine decarboxylase-like enzyme
MVAIDLFSCGAIKGELVIEHLVRSLGLESVTLRQVPRGVGQV